MNKDIDCTLNADDFKILYKVKNIDNIGKIINIVNNYDIYILANKKEIEEIEKM